MSRRRHSDRTRAVTPEPRPAQPEPADPATRLRTAIDALTQPTTVQLQRHRYPGCWCAPCAELAALDHYDRAHFKVPIAAARIAARRTGTAHVPPLLEQLLGLAGSNNNTDGGPSRSVYRSLIDPMVTELLADISHTVSDGTTINLIRRVRAWASVANVDIAVAWAKTADQILNPPRRFSLRGACPKCRHSIAYVKDEAGQPGDTVRRDAIEIDLTTGTGLCLHCHEETPPHLVEWLAKVVRDQPTVDRPAIRSIAHGRGGAWDTPAQYPLAPRVHFPDWVPHGRIEA
jgi:hypothetical protein